MAAPRRQDPEHGPALAVIPVGPAAAPPARARRSPVIAELAVIAFLGWVYDWLQNLAPLRAHLALSNGARLLGFEHRLGIDPERALDHWLAAEHTLAYISSDFYDNAIFGVTFALAAWTWWRRPDLYRPLRNDLVLANVVGFAVFFVYPVAPPRMLHGFVDVVAKVGGLGSWHQTLLNHADQFAAMPSMHLGWAVWCSLVAWRLARRPVAKVVAVVFAVAYPLATALDVMATANHYLMDVLAGTGATVCAVALVEVAAPAALRRWPGPASWLRAALRRRPLATSGRPRSS